MKFLLFNVLLGSLLVVTLLSGCAVVRQARLAQKEHGATRAAGERTVTPAEAGLRADTILKLGEAERIARQWHPAMAQATQAVVAAEIALHQAGLALRPSLSTSVGYTGSTQGSSRNDWTFDSSDEILSASLSLSWVLYDFGRTRASRRQAVEGLISACEEFRDAHIQRTFNVRIAYFTAAEADALCTVEEENLKQYDELLRRAELRFSVGSGRKYDVTKARVDRSNALYSLIAARNATVTAQANLNNEMGFSGAPFFALERNPNLPQVPTHLVTLIQLATTNQPTLKSLTAKVQAASAALDKAIAELYPQIAIQASPNYAASATQSAGVSWGISFLQTLFSGWNKQDAIRLAEVALRQARSRLALQEQQISRDLTTTLADLQSAQESMDVSEAMEAQALENLELVTQQFTVGAASLLEVTDAQVAHTRAKIALVSARFKLEKTKGKVLLITGM